MYLYEAGLATVVNDVDSLLPSPILQQLRCPLAVHLFGCCPVTKLALYSGSLFIYMPYFVIDQLLLSHFLYLVFCNIFGPCLGSTALCAEQSFILEALSVLSAVLCKVLQY